MVTYTDLLSLLFPPFCIGCGYAGRYLCPSCLSSVRTHKAARCLMCGKRSALGLTHVSCKGKNGLDGFVSLYRYDGLLKRALMEIKYRHAHRLLKELLFAGAAPDASYQTLWRWAQLFKPVIVPVPLHRQREQERGFNQSSLIAKHLALILGRPYSEPLNRIINTPHLANAKNRQERQTLIRGAFTCAALALPRTVLLVDDVSTSGATLKECCRALKQNGVLNVLAFSLAK